MKFFEMYFLLFVFLFVNAAKGQELPVKNKSIIAFAENKKGKKVGTGECWDLAKAALDNAGAIWTSPYGFGKEVAYKNESVLPGDIIQFEKVKIINPDKSSQEFPHHTAIIYQVMGSGKYIVAEQNSNGKRFVIFTELNLNNIKKGKYSIFRPQ